MAVSAKDLRYKTREILQSVKRGEKPMITYRGQPIAQIIPVFQSKTRSFRPIGFGMWKEHKNMKDVNQWLLEQRKPRFVR